MTRSACPSCRLRFSRVTAAHLTACPFCAQQLQDLSPSDVLGFRLLSLEPLLGDAPVARAVALELARTPGPEHAEPRP